jgi:hypothetical protein
MTIIDFVPQCADCGYETGKGHHPYCPAYFVSGAARGAETALPYPDRSGQPTQGHSGSETSRERALEEASTGTAAERQAETQRLLDVFASEGVTVSELREFTGWHHGQASSVLSVLHKEEKIARLAMRRNRCHVYVLPEYVNGRATDKQGRQPKDPDAEFRAFKAGIVLGRQFSVQGVGPAPSTMRRMFDNWKAGQ